MDLANLSGKAADLAAKIPQIDSTDHVPDGQAVQDFMYVLDRHRIECEESGKYEEAELARSRLEQLQQHEENRRRAELRSDQLAERLGVEEAHMRELQEFNELWDQKMADFESHAEKLQSMLAERHQQEHASNQAKMKKYKDASKVKVEADGLEAREHDKWMQTREAKIAALEEQFLHKQRLEMGGLLKRIQSGRDEQKQARKTELERLLQRYHNVKTSIESQQTIIRLRAEKYPQDWVHTSTMASTTGAPGANGS